MPKRPQAVPELAVNPVSGSDVVQPISDVRNHGFATADRPPAQWLNFLFYLSGAWIQFLRGPNVSELTRTTITPTVKRVDADTVTAEDTAVLFRIAGTDQTTATKLQISRRGNSWHQNSIAVASGTVGTVIDVVFHTADSAWIIGTDDGAGGARILWTYPSGHTGPTSAIDDDTQNWGSYTLPGGCTPIVAIQRGGPSGQIAVVTAGQIMWGPVIGSFSNATISGAAPVGNFVDVIYTGSSWIAVTSAGEIYRATAQGGTFTKNGTTMGSATWKLASDGGGTVFAVRLLSVRASNSYLSTDDGATWNAKTSPQFDSFSDIQYRDGAWFLTLTDAPYLATASDTQSTSWLRIPTPYVEGSNHDLRTFTVSEGQFIATGAGFVLQSTRAADLSPSAWTPGNTPASQFDAAYLQSRVLASTAPTSAADRIGWNPGSNQWEPTSTYRQSFPFAHAAIPINQTDHQMNFGGGMTTNLASAVMPRAGSVTALSMDLSGNAAGSTIVFHVFKNGAYLTGVTASITAGSKKVTATFTPGTYTFAANDELDIRLTTDGSWTGTTLTAGGSIEILA